MEIYATISESRPFHVELAMQHGHTIEYGQFPVGPRVLWDLNTSDQDVRMKYLLSLGLLLYVTHYFPVLAGELHSKSGKVTFTPQGDQKEVAIDTNWGNTALNTSCSPRWICPSVACKFTH